MTSSRRRGRLPVHERDARRAEILSAAAAELVEVGALGLTMAAVARRAGASKETLYAWFGGRDELLAALIERNADESMAAITKLLDGVPKDLEEARGALVAFAHGLLSLLVGPGSVELNRAAVASPALAQRLLASGRHRVGPEAESFLAGLQERGLLDVPDPAEAFRTFYGLTIRDTQIRVLLGEPAPGAAEIAATADRAVEQFLVLVGRGPG